jgi:hypothetical protein
VGHRIGLFSPDIKDRKRKKSIEDINPRRYYIIKGIADLSLIQVNSMKRLIPLVLLLSRIHAQASQWAAEKAFDGDPGTFHGLRV